MNKFKKAISVGMSAALLASLFTVIAAGTVFGATTVTSAGSVPRGGTSTGTVTITLTENAAACLAEAGDPASTITINDSNGGDVTWSGTAVVSAPDSLGATVTRAGAILTIDTSGSSDAVQEQIVITGLTITAASTAAPGAITAALVDGTVGSCWTATTRTATGTVSVGIAAGSTSVIVNLTSTCQFIATGGTAGPLAFATAPESVDITAAPAAGPGANQQTLPIDATANNHQLGETVTQAGVPTGALTCPATLSSPGTVVDALEQDATSVQIFPGENNQTAGDTTVSEVNAGFLGAGTVVTFTLTPDGVLFSGGSSSPSLTAVSLTLTSGTCAVSVDRKSCTATVDTASVAPGSITLENPSLDVAATVPAGTLVKAVVTTSPSKLVNVTSNTIAVVSRIIVAVAGVPTIFINQNDQQTGQITLTEQGAGFFTAGPGPNNVFGVCLQSGESFTRAPWAVVTAGDLKVFSGLVGAAQARGTLFNGNTCARWAVFSASTAASTIEIRGTDASDVVLPSGALNGPRVNVPAGSTPGPTLVDVLIGSLAEVEAETGLTTRVSNAVRAFKSGVLVAAVSQPVIQQGTTDGLAGNITITETLAGQFKLGQDICLEILPRSSTGVFQSRQDTFLKTANTNDLPVISTNMASGLLATRFFVDDDEVCLTINQQAVNTLGVITISNMHYTTLADAPFGPVLVRVSGDTGGGAVAFESVVSNARIGALSVAEATINRGLNTRSGFGFGTEIVNRGAYVTIRSRASGSAPGDLVQIWVKTKTTPWALETSRRVSPNGFMYYSGKVLNSGYRYYRVLYVAQGALSNTVRAYGR